MITCISGCTMPGHHQADCADKKCLGCWPRLADVGGLCFWCNQRLTAAIVDIPSVVSFLMGSPLTSIRSPLGRVDAGRGQPSGSSLFRPQVAAAEELIGLLGSWVDLILVECDEDFPDPPLRGVVITPPAVRDRKGEVLVAGPQMVRASLPALEDLCSWVRRRLPWVAWQSWAPEMMRELSSFVATCWARWPYEEDSYHLPIPCPVCKAFSLEVNPPSEFRVARVVSCSSEACGRLWIEDDWETVMRSAVDGLSGGKAGA